MECLELSKRTKAAAANTGQKEDHRIHNLFEFNFDSESRRIYLNDGIDAETIDFLVKAIHYLETKGRKPIQMFINTTGGNVEDMFLLYDAMKTSPCKLVTIATGAVCSAGGPLLVAGDLRLSTNRAVFMAHPMTAFNMGNTEEIEAQGAITKKVEAEFWNIMGAHTKKTGAQWKTLVHKKREIWYEADEMLKEEIVDIIVKPGDNINKIISTNKFRERILV